MTAIDNLTSKFGIDHAGRVIEGAAADFLQHSLDAP